MKQRKYLAPILGTLCMFVLAGPVFAGHMMHQGHMMHRGQDSDFFATKCIGWDNLTEPEKKEVMDLVKDFKAETFPEVTRYMALQGDLNAELSQKTIDDAKIQKIVRECNELRNRIFNKRIKFQLKLKKKYDIFFDLGPGMGFYHGFGQPRGQMRGEFCPRQSY